MGEVAEELCVTHSAVSQLRARGLALLRSQLAAYELAA